ncbi:Protein of unknown function [Chitinophaga rupis]|uniref:Acyl carrier protein n=1 Tax=Chitinophaga rupis TaxID=573321 RepID=A0A1H8KA29_9BACT|nr:DUF1493 family protein [Chitinophaga rupis]SEN89366.1 Protein of unknown function [Chitinophaga rupis]
MKENILDDLIAFLYRETRGYEVVISEDTEIESDLGVTGDDGEELICKFAKIYNVDITNFYFTKYFYPESMTSYHSNDVKVLKVRDLLNAVKAGKLNDDIIGK